METSSVKDSKEQDKIENKNDESPEQIFQLTEKVSPPKFSPQIDTTWLVLMGLAASLRMYNLSNPNAVVFDEVHFGKFTSYIMQGKFFFDVHPPLGKLLFAAAAYWSGFDGSFEFEVIGHEIPAAYKDHVYALRLLPTLFSVLLVPMVYEFILELGCSYWFAVFGGILICFENMFIVQSKFILLDSMLLFFIALSLCSYIKFVKQYTRPFTVVWWTCLLVLGFSLAATMSIKYNGLLTVLLIGGIVTYEVWILMGDVSVPPASVFYHLTARFFCLIILPILLYLGQFYILLSLLHKSGPHDNLMSSAFQRTLQGGLSSITADQADVVAFGSQVTLRNTHGQQCWLHSHPDLYPVKYPDGRGSSAQQQVTCYAFKDINNWWIIKHPDGESLASEFPPRPVKNGDIIHMVHGTSGRGLNSHDVAAPQNPQYMEVSGYVDHNVSMDAQLGFRVEIVNPDASGVWKAIESQVRLVHVNTTASIKVTGEFLPDWGFHQFEVATDRMVNTQESIWNVEEHNQNITLPQGMSEEEAKKVLEKQNTDVEITDLSFFQKFWELQLQMLKVNSMMTQEHAFASRPFDWPLLRKGIAYWIDANSNKQIFCMGNPFVWWMGTLSLISYFALLLVYLLRRRRCIFDLSNEQWNLYVIAGYLLAGGHLFNFLPFLPMERTLFVHHYLPCLLYKVMLTAFLADHVYTVLCRGTTILRQLFTTLCVAYTLALMWCFNYFSPFTYGTVHLDASGLQRKQWLSTWEFVSH